MKESRHGSNVFQLCHGEKIKLEDDDLGALEGKFGVETGLTYHSMYLGIYKEIDYKDKLDGNI